MKTFGKYIRPAIGILWAILLVVTFVCARNAHTVAYADDDVVVSDLVSAEITYGEETRHFYARVGLVNYDKFDYAWYRSDTLSGLPLKVSEATSDDGYLYLELYKPSESGYYRAEVTRVYADEDDVVGRAVSVETNTVLMQFLPRLAEVEISDRELIYDGTWQRPAITVKEEYILPGDQVSAYADTGVATVNAGTYDAEIRLDNELYTVSGEREFEFTIEKAPLQIKIKDLAVRSDTEYSFEIEYVGLKGEDRPVDLGFSPTISSSYYGYRSPGNYAVFCAGESETANYIVTYPKGNLYIAKGTLRAEEITGCKATANGMFRNDTVLTMTAGEKKVKGLPFLGIVKYNYGINFTNGASEGETYEIVIEDKKISPFMLAVCYTDTEGKIHAVSRFSQKDGKLTVVLPSENMGSLVIYNDYTVLVIVASVLVLIFLIVAIALGKSKAKFRRRKYFYEQAQELADEYRTNRDEYGRPKDNDDFLV